MWKDPIVEDVRKWRDEYAAEFDYDLEAIGRDLRGTQKAPGRKVVSFPPRRIPKTPLPPVAPDIPSAAAVSEASR
jgi:hypothetical protein